MKRTLILIHALAISYAGAFAQETEVKTEEKKDDTQIRTLFSSSDVPNGGYGALLFNATSYDNQAAYQLGVRGAWLINHRFGIGVDGNVNLNTAEKTFDLDPARGLVDPLDSTKGPTAKLNILYGGLMIEYIIKPDAPVHVSIPVVFGGGSASYLNKDEIENAFINDSVSSVDKFVYSKDQFFYIQPGIELDMNLLKFMRLGFGLHYRMLFGLNMLQTEETAFDGMGATIGLKFGKF